MPAASGDKQIPRSEEVFISYSRKDKEFVRRLDEELKRRDREAWVDWEGIPPGDTWEKTIYGAIEATHTFIFVLTPDSIASEVYGREIAHAHTTKLACFANRLDAGCRGQLGAVQSGWSSDNDYLR